MIKPKVLVVDDNRDISRAYAFLDKPCNNIEGLGLVVKKALNGNGKKGGHKL